MFQKVFIRLFRKTISLALVLGAVLLVGYLASDRTNYPGRKEFEVADDRINTSTDQVAHGASEEEKKTAASFSKTMKAMQAALFTGGSGKSFATGGEFLTYVQRSPNSVVILCHVPELRNYKEAKTREALAKLAWANGKIACANLQGLTGSETLIIGLRGFSLYGPIWEGTVSGEVTKKTDESGDVKRLYPFFAPQTVGAVQAAK